MNGIKPNLSGKRFGKLIVTLEAGIKDRRGMWRSDGQCSILKLNEAALQL